MTFINEGNPNYVDKLVNFEKMASKAIKKNHFQQTLAWIDFMRGFFFFSSLVLAAHDCKDSEHCPMLQKSTVL